MPVVRCWPITACDGVRSFQLAEAECGAPRRLSRAAITMEDGRR
jgi:hypothetical protein